MKNHKIRKVSFAKGLSYPTLQAFAEAFPHLTTEEVEHYFPKVSKPAAQVVKESEAPAPAKKKD